MDFEIKNYPDKSWSISKMKVIENCYRQYYYTYYGSHNGWLNDSCAEAKMAWRLKKLTNIWLLFGDKLHEAISSNLKKRNINITSEGLKNYLRNSLNYVVKDSSLKEKTGAWNEYPKGDMLQEYYYGQGLDNSTILEIKDRIDKCTNNFVSCNTYTELKEDMSKLLEADEGSFDFINLYGFKIYALIDALYIDKDGNYIIVDWKTGHFNEYDSNQLKVYAIYVMERYNVPLNKIRGRIEYLLTGEKYEYSFSEKKIEDMKILISEDIKVINNFLESPEENIPKKKEVFRKCEDEKKCSKCKYKLLCFDLEGII